MRGPPNRRLPGIFWAPCSTQYHLFHQVSSFGSVAIVGSRFRFRLTPMLEVILILWPAVGPLLQCFDQARNSDVYASGTLGRLIVNVGMGASSSGMDHRNASRCSQRDDFLSVIVGIVRSDVASLTPKQGCFLLALLESPPPRVHTTDRPSQLPTIPRRGLLISAGLPIRWGTWARPLVLSITTRVSRILTHIPSGNTSVTLRIGLFLSQEPGDVR